MHEKIDIIQFFRDYLVERTERPTIRHWKLLRLLSESPEGLPLKELAERLGVTPRTVNRDLALFQDAGIPVQEPLFCSAEEKHCGGSTKTISRPLQTAGRNGSSNWNINAEFSKIESSTTLTMK